MVKNTITLILILMVTSIAQADVSLERREKSMEIFSEVIDKLLIDTAHVYVNPQEHIGGFYLPGAGMFFIGQISITSRANMSYVYKDWTKWFSGDNAGNIAIYTDLDDLDDLEDLEDLEDLDALEKEKAEQHKEKLKEADKKLEELEKKFNTKYETYKKIEDEDRKRLESMDIHLDGFKQELAIIVRDYAPILKGMEDSDKIVIVFFFKDAEFKKKYKTKSLVMQVPYKKVNDLDKLSDDDPKLLRTFMSNIP